MVLHYNFQTSWKNPFIGKTFFLSINLSYNDIENMIRSYQHHIWSKQLVFACQSFRKRIYPISLLISWLLFNFYLPKILALSPIIYNNHITNRNICYIENADEEVEDGHAYLIFSSHSMFVFNRLTMCVIGDAVYICFNTSRWVLLVKQCVYCWVLCEYDKFYTIVT